LDHWDGEAPSDSQPQRGTDILRIRQLHRALVLIWAERWHPPGGWRSSHHDFQSQRLSERSEQSELRSATPG